MLRWLVLLVLLGNALLFLWYAQEYRFSDTIRQPDIRPAAIRLPNELEVAEQLVLRPRECGYFQSFESEYEAEKLLVQLESYGVEVDVYDPWVDTAEAKREYGVEMTEAPEGMGYDAMIVAVAHDKFFIGNSTKAFGKPLSVVFDVKGILPRSAGALRL